MEIILSCVGGDFEIYKEEKYNMTFYHIAIEGYVGSESIEDFIDLYSFYLDELEEFLIKGEYPKIEVNRWNTIYKTQGIEVCYEMDYYWIFLDGYESTDIWDLYYYLEDVINQLKEVEVVDKEF